MGGGGAARRRWDEQRRLAPFSDLEAQLRGSAVDGPVLDLGCGPGLWLARIEAAGHVAVGVEPDRSRAAAAYRSAPVAVADAAAIPFGDATVGLVWCLHVLHHVVNPSTVLAEVFRVLRPGGRLLLAESVEDSPLIRLARNRWPQWEGVPVRSRFRAAELTRLVAGTGLDVVSYRQHGPVSPAALVVRRGGQPLWTALRWLEGRVPDRSARLGAYVDVVARRPG
ncbi:MAG TPA: class I SAM-dependent methyltransferase [Acidimicrobiales bacterium]|nr:class I SAM-dependent methyltransferase [Acidimicrobiales bacterium]